MAVTEGHRVSTRARKALVPGAVGRANPETVSSSSIGNKMKSRSLCYALSIGVAMLGGCGGSQPPTAMPQTSAGATHAGSGESWMLPEAKSKDLLYVSKLTRVLVYAYPTAKKVVGNLTGFDDASGLCSDRSGDVWVTDFQKSQVSEYAHGGTEPIAVLSDENDPIGCAVDPKSGDLAVANYADNVSIYAPGSGNPIIYTAPDFYFMEFCSYDGSGNLFIDGYRGTHEGHERSTILELSYGGTRLQRFKLEGRPRTKLRFPGGMQWDGKSLVVGYAGKYDSELYRISNLGRFGKITKRVTLTAPDGGFIPGEAPFVLYKGYIIGAYNVGTTQISNIAFWPYPGGGAAIKEFKVRGKYYPAGLALSVAPN